MRSSFHDHMVMVKVPILRFTALYDTEKSNRNRHAKDDARVGSQRWLGLLNGLHTTFRFECVYKAASQCR